MKHIFIINPVSGLSDKTEQIREHLKIRSDIESIVFNTEEAGHETRIMTEMLDIFDDEPVRICICGGSGTLSNALDGMDASDMDHVEIGYYPCGLTNDFMKNFVEQGKKFEDLDALIDGNTKYIDYMRCVVDGDDKNVKNKILFATVGIAANIEKTSRLIKFVGGISPAVLYAICSAITVPFSQSVDYEVIIDGVDYSKEYKMIYVGNSLCFGGGFIPIKTGVDCRDGLLNVLLIKKIPFLHLIEYLTDFQKGDICEKHKEDTELITCREILIRRKDNKSMVINADGEIFSSNSWHIKVVNGRLKFVVPEAAKFIEGPKELIKNLFHA